MGRGAWPSSCILIAWQVPPSGQLSGHQALSSPGCFSAEAFVSLASRGRRCTDRGELRTGWSVTSWVAPLSPFKPDLALGKTVPVTPYHGGQEGAGQPAPCCPSDSTHAGARGAGTRTAVGQSRLPGAADGSRDGDGRDRWQGLSRPHWASHRHTPPT